MVAIENTRADLASFERKSTGAAWSPPGLALPFEPTCGVDGAFYWLTRLLSANRRDALYPLRVFCRDVRDIRDGTISLPLKVMLLAGWRNQIAFLYAGRPQHAVAAKMQCAIERYGLRCSDFLSIIGEAEDGARQCVRAPSRERLDVLCEQTTVVTCRLALRILGATPREADRASEALGRGLRFTGILNHLAKDAAAHRLYLPRELLQAHGIFATIPSYVLAQPALSKVCDAFAEEARAYFADAQQVIAEQPQLARRAATLMLVSHRHLLEALVARGWHRLSEPVHIPARHRAVVRIGRDFGTH